MGRQSLPDKLVDLLREMRTSGVTVEGLVEATGLPRTTVCHYTDPPKGNKWTEPAVEYLRQNYHTGESLDDLTAMVQAITGRSDISRSAVLVKVGQLKLHRDEPNNGAKAHGRKEYWRKWRAGEITNNSRCPPPNARSQS